MHGPMQQGAWIIVGDFNAIKHLDDTLNGNLVQEFEVADFHKFLVDTNTAKLKTTGRRYTWINNHTHSKID